MYLSGSRGHRRRSLLLGGSAALLSLCISPVTASAQALPDRARDALRRATLFIRTLATEGGYLWVYSEDLTERAGENKATASQVWVQSPGTPSVGMAFLRAYAATGETLYLQAAQAAARALVRGQLESGGWDYLIDFDPIESRKSFRRLDTSGGDKPPNRRNISTFDDDNTQGALRFLLAFADVAGAAGGAETADLRDARSAVDYGLAKMLEAQYPNGAWPQRYESKRPDPAKHPVTPAVYPKTYPREHPKVSYYGHYTLNDNTQRDCIRTLLDAYRRLGKTEYLRAAQRGGDILILAQLPPPQPAWAQQYNAAMEPAWARVFEPPAVSSRESADAIRTLVELYQATRDEKYLKPIPAAIAWFKRSEIAPNRWSRYYELQTNKPIYGDRDGKIHYTLAELSEERRTGYAWEGTFGVASAIRLYEDATKPAGKTAVPKPVTREELATLEAAATRAVTSLDARGRWITSGRIQTRTFIENVTALATYLEAVSPAGTPPTKAK